MEIRVRAPKGQFLLERLLGGDEGLTIEIRGFELSILNALVQRVAEVIKDVPGITDVQTSIEAGVPQQDIQVDRSKIADLDLTVRNVTQLLETAVAGSKAGGVPNGGQFLSYSRSTERCRKKRSLDEILNLTLATENGEQVALRNLVATEQGRGPLLIDRKNQQRMVTVQANVAGRDLGFRSPGRTDPA